MSFLERLKPSNKFLNSCRAIAEAEAVQFQIGVDDRYWLHGPIGLKFNFRRYASYVSMRFESY